MAMSFGQVKGDLIRSLGEMVHESNATAGSLTTLVDTNTLHYPDDYLNDYYVYIWSGPGAGQERRISDFVQATSTITVSPAWTTVPTILSWYYIYTRRFNNAAYSAALRQALRLLRKKLLLPVEDTSISIGDPSLAASYSVSVPGGMVAIQRILREDGTIDGLYTWALPGPHESDAPWWYVSLSGTAYNIVFDKAIADAEGWMVQGRRLKIVGQKFQTEPSADSDSIEVNAGPIIELAAHLLVARDLREPAIARIWANIYDRITESIGTGFWPSCTVLADS